MRLRTASAPSELPCRLATPDLCTLPRVSANSSCQLRHRRRAPRLAPARPPHCFDGHDILAALGAPGR
eukprot:1885235-Prymnesium_polylepis.1